MTPFFLKKILPPPGVNFPMSVLAYLKIHFLEKLKKEEKLGHPINIVLWQGTNLSVFELFVSCVFIIEMRQFWKIYRDFRKGGRRRRKKKEKKKRGRKKKHNLDMLGVEILTLYLKKKIKKKVDRPTLLEDFVRRKTVFFFVCLFVFFFCRLIALDAFLLGGQHASVV